MNRPNKDIWTEAIIIGIMNVVLFYTIRSISKFIPISIAVLIAGISIHVLFEYTGGNEWWCKRTYKL